MRCKLLVLLCLATSPVVKAQAWLWGAMATSYLNGESEPLGLDNCAAADGLGNAYGVSDVYGTIVFGSDTVMGGYSSPAPYFIKYDKYGNFLWVRGAKLLTAYSWGEAMSVACYKNTAEYVVGTYSGNVVLGNDTLKSVYGYNMYLIKYTPAGTIAWGDIGISANGYSNFNATSVAVNDSGDVFVAGYYNGIVVVGNDTLKQPHNLLREATFLIKYDSNGNVLWIRQSTAAVDGMYACGNSVVADHQGNAYLTGFFTDTIGFGPYQLQNSGNTKAKQMFLVKYNAAGNALWAKQTDGKSANDNIDPLSIAMDAFGKLYITGSIADTIIFGKDSVKGGAINNTCFLTKYDTAGNMLWLKLGTWSSSNVLSNYSLVATDTLTHGGVGVLEAAGSGHFTFGDTTFTWVIDSANNPSVNVVLQFDTAGNVLCGNMFWEGFDDDGGDGLAIDPAGHHVYLDGDLDATNYLNIYGLDTLAASNLREPPFMLGWSPCCHVPVTMSFIDTTICLGSSISIKASGADSYYWLQTNNVHGDTASSITVTPSGNQLVYGVLGTKAGCSSIATATVNINYPPSIYISPSNPSICYGDSMVLSASGGGSYVWSTGATTSNLRVLPLTNTTYTLTVKSGVCAKDTTATITVNPIPALTVSFPSDDCSGVPVLLSASGASTYQWTPIAGLSCDTCANTYASPPATIPYTVTGTNIYGCSATVTDTLHVWPVFTVMADSVAETIPCNGSAKVTVTGGKGPFKYAWSPGGGTNDSITGKCAGTYCCRITDYYGCMQKVCIVIKSATGIENISNPNGEITIYPNPGKGKFDLTTANYEAENKSQLSVYNSLGQEIYKNQFTISKSPFAIDLSAQPDGVYLYRVLSLNGELIGQGKIVIQR